MKNMLFTALLWCLITNAFTQDNYLENGLNSITREALQAQMEFLASDWTEGREVATPGAYMAADYIASLFRLYGLQPAGDYEWTEVSYAERRQGKKAEKYRTYFQNFKMIRKDDSEDNFLAINENVNGSNKTTYFNYQTDYSYSNLPGTGMNFEAPVVFVGYGYVNKEENYNDYKGIDAEGKVILRLSGYPGFDDTASAAYRKFTPEAGIRSYWYPMQRAKNIAAIEQGAIAVIDIPYGDVPDYWVKNYPFRFNMPYYEGDEKPENTYNYSLDLVSDTLEESLINITISKSLYHKLIEGQELDVEAYKKRAAEKLKPGAKEVENKKLLFNTKTNSQIVQCRNVLGVLEGKKQDEIIVVGAHYDHLGSYDGYIWNGADDNASGTVAVMTIARAMMESGKQPEKTIVFACWTGEEKGLLGSRYFVEQPYGDTIDHIIMNMNYDMISRNPHGDSLGVKGFMSYSESTPELKEFSEQHIKDYHLNLELNYRASKGGGGGSDHAPFNMKGIPFYFIITGMHEDYHQPTDHLSKINYDKMLDVVKLGYLNLWKMANEE